MNVTSPGASPLTSTSLIGSESSFTHVEGYDYEFYPPLDAKYECPICLNTLREPRQTNCGHRFCRDCILRCLRESGKRCPVDNESLTEQEIFPDNFAKREILNCNVMCRNRKDGCQAIMSLSRMQAHMEECSFSLNPCPYNCASILPRKEMQEHIEQHCIFRQIDCPLCQGRLRANELEDHALVCPKSTVCCQFCGAELKRDEIEQHKLETCEKVVVPCPFHMFGCHTENERGKEGEHLMADVPSHLKQLSHITSYLLHHLGNTALRLNQNGTQLNHGQSALLDGVSGALSNLKVNNQFPRQGITQASHSFKPPEPHHAQLHRNRSNPVDVGSQSSLQDVHHRTSLPHSCPLMGFQGSMGESADGKNSLQQMPHAPCTPQLLSGNYPCSPRVVNGSPWPPIVNQVNAMSADSESSGKHYRSMNGNLTPPSSTTSSMSHPKPTPTPLNVNRVLQSTLQEPAQSMGEKNIHNFVTTLQELCTWQSENITTQHHLIENLHLQVSQLQRSNQELVKQVRDLESRSLHFDTRTHCGDFYWRISDYSGLRKKASNGETSILHSDAFMTSPWGYKLCVRANFSGFVNNDHEHYLSLFIHFMQGSNDTLLRWPFKGQIILSVINQSDLDTERQHIVETLEAKPHLEAFRQPTSARNHKGFGFTEFVTLTTLEKGSFIRNNTLVIRAQVFPMD